MKAWQHRLGIVLVAGALALQITGVFGLLLRMHGSPPTVGVFFLDAPVAEARRVISPEVSRVVHQRDNVVKVTGFIECTAGQTLELRVRVTQGTAVAAGTTQDTICTGHRQRWIVYATTDDGELLETGGVTVHVWAHTMPEDVTREWDDQAKLVAPK